MFKKSVYNLNTNHLRLFFTFFAGNLIQLLSACRNAVEISRKQIISTKNFFASLCDKVGRSDFSIQIRANSIQIQFTITLIVGLNKVKTINSMKIHYFLQICSEVDRYNYLIKNKNKSEHNKKNNVESDLLNAVLNI